jgi:hypothetical protein
MSMEDISMCIYNNTITPTYLYIKQHSITRLKYFGKTTKQDPYKYLGSGKYWRKHIKKYGAEFVKTLWVSDLYTDKTLIREIALHFSYENNIVESNEWANLIYENGLDGMDSIEAKKRSLHLIKNGTHLFQLNNPSNKRLSCPHCGISGDTPNMKKYHFDKCPIIFPSSSKIVKCPKCHATGPRTLMIENHFGNCTITHVKCPHCNKLGKAGQAMNREHFDNCKTIISPIKLICPHCGITGTGNAMLQHHFDNCPVVKPKDLIVCPHCNKTGTSMVRMQNWHFDNCKKLKSRNVVVCPHCGKSGVINGMTRYHFDNCKLRI